MIYSDLVDAIHNFRDDIEITQSVHTFIALAEAQLNRRLVCREMWDYAAVVIQHGRGVLPQDFLAVESVQLENGRKLKYVSPQMMDERTPNGRGPHGSWDEYTLAGDKLIVDPWMRPEPNSPSMLAKLRYRRRLDALSPSNEVNWLLAKHPDAYLYGALVQSCAFKGSDQKDDWQAGYDLAVGDIAQADLVVVSDTLDMSSNFGGRVADHHWRGY
ncbi:MAG: phage adaptor protein [Caulobacteraceae bacterium]